MEKKLTDEEIVVALKCCQRNEEENTCAFCLSCPASEWEYEEDMECQEYMMQKAIDLIHRLQEENKDLKEERENMQDEIFGLEEELEKAYEIERANIQAEIAEAGTSCHWCKEQAVKDTAKKYNDFIHALICKYNSGIDDNAYGNMHKEANEFANRNGVEVE